MPKLVEEINVWEMEEIRKDIGLKRMLVVANQALKKWLIFHWEPPIIQGHAQLLHKRKCVCTLQDFYKFMRDDSALLRAARARWLLTPCISGSDDRSSQKVRPV